MSPVPAPTPPETIIIDAALDLQSAIPLRDALLSRLDRTSPVAVDLTAAAATAPALQLAAALRASLAERGCFAGYGPIAARAFDRTEEAAE